MELLVVLAIVGTLMGLSIGVYRQLAVSYQVPAAASQLGGVLRSARNFSRTSGLPSRVLVEPLVPSISCGRVTAFGYELVAAFHFEDALPTQPKRDTIVEGSEALGAYGERARITGEIESVPGVIGRALRFLDDGAALSAPGRARYWSERGFALEAWVLFEQPELTEAEQKDRARKKKRWVDPRREVFYAVLGMPGSYEMGLLGDGAVYVQIGRVDPKEGAVDESDYLVRTAAGEVVAHRWAHLRASYDGIELEIEVDGIARHWVPDGYDQILKQDWLASPPVPPAKSDLWISHPKRMFLGSIDEPRIFSALPPRILELGSGVKVHGGVQTVHFDGRGSLDAEKHSSPVVIELSKADAEVEAPAVRGVTRVTEKPGADPSKAGGKTAAGDKSAPPAETDVLEALAKYLKEKQEDSAGLREGAKVEIPAAPGSGPNDSKDPSRKVILVDLTGTIRG